MVLEVKNLLANARDVKKGGFNPWVGKIPWSRAWQPTPVFFSGESHGHRNLVGCKELGTSEVIHHACTHVPNSIFNTEHFGVLS